MPKETNRFNFNLKHAAKLKHVIVLDFLFLLVDGLVVVVLLCILFFYFEKKYIGQYLELN